MKDGKVWNVSHIFKTSFVLLSFLDAQIPPGIPIIAHIIRDTKTIYNVIIALTQYPEVAINKTNKIQDLITNNENKNTDNLNDNTQGDTIEKSLLEKIKQN